MRPAEPSVSSPFRLTHVPPTVHADLRANPFLEKIVLNTVAEKLATLSSGKKVEGGRFFRLAELHFKDFDAYDSAWLLAPGAGPPLPRPRGLGLAHALPAAPSPMPLRTAGFALHAAAPAALPRL